MQQMCRGVIPPRRVADVGIDFSIDEVANVERSRIDVHAMRARKARTNPREAFDLRGGALADDAAAVRYLTAGFQIEGGLSQSHITDATAVKNISRSARFVPKAGHPRVCARCVVADEDILS